MNATSTRTKQIVATAALLALLAACRSNNDRSTAASEILPTMPAIEEGTDSPPNNQTILTSLYATPLAQLGYRLTTGSTRDETNGDYTATGTQLALYTQANHPATPDAYDQDMIDLASTLIPDAFARWPAITSIDLCQQRGDHDTTGAVTQLTITRTASDHLDWSNTTLEELHDLTAEADSGIQLFVHDTPP